MAWSDYVESAVFPKNMSFKQYKKQKLKILERDFCIHLTEEEQERWNNLTTEAQVDQFFLGIINNRWG